MTSENDRQAAKEFLLRLQEHLGHTVTLSVVTDWMRKTVRVTEWDFVDKLVLNEVSAYLTQAMKPAGKNVVREAFLAEATDARNRGLTSGSPVSAKKYLFTKDFEGDLSDAVKLWWESSDKGVSQSCPDWAFREPCPHTVVFEAKLFRGGSLDAARKELVKGIYQCFYYRAHPETEKLRRHAAWKYDYACLFAYDASQEQNLVKAFNSLSQIIKDACWDSANIFVMVLPSDTNANREFWLP